MDQSLLAAAQEGRDEIHDGVAFGRIADFVVVALREIPA